MNRTDAPQSMRQILVKRRDSLRKALAGDLSSLKELRERNPCDMADAAQDSIDDLIASQMTEVYSRELGSVLYALERMDNGQFGICEDCGKNIPLARLQALPHATLCFECKRKAELQDGDPKNEEDTAWVSSVGE